MSPTTASRRLRQSLATLAALALPLGLLAACAEAPQQSRSEQSQYDACHRIADQVVTHANADALAQSDPTSSPFAATSTLPNSTNALAIEHQRQDVMTDCMRHLDTQPANVGDITATPQGGATGQPITPPPADLAEPTGSDLTKPPILPPAQ
ncbi:hypothetical protein ACELLULO517_03590 [Acidisoma cellulosilytica]|uniref:Secreted protein n=1 Tax=Acidisoma cellulosilyticum TaxID=2802395 RepID=A0A963YY43_9PROT|nr:hypothetical protein [Acidisoma cellulosilyticum]MCB8879304.1 hypothetical protein [Acidisoma cellulosilyticum]